jgi:hypothetical protein
VKLHQPSEQDAAMLLALLTGRASFSDDIDWWGVLKTAELHRMLLPLRARLEKWPDLPVPASARQELDHSFWAWAVKRRACLELLWRIGSIASENRVPLLLLKGPYIAERLHESPRSRPFRDLDLMVEESSFDLLVRRLVEAGFGFASSPFEGLPSEVLRRWELPITLVPRNAPGLEVDLHMNITHRLEPYRVSPEEIWKKAEPWGMGLLRLSDDDFLLFLFIHSLKHGYFSLLSFYDLHLAAQDPLLAGRFRCVLERAEREGFGSLVRVSAELGQRLFGTTWPHCGPVSRKERLAAGLLEARVRLGRPWISERFQLLLTAGLLVNSVCRLWQYWRRSLFRPLATIPPRRHAASPWSNPWASSVRLIRWIRNNAYSGPPS